MGRGVHEHTRRIERCVIEELAPLTAPASVRAYAYQLFNRKLIPNMSKGATNRVSLIIKRLRELGWLDWMDVVDETRKPERISQWSDPESLVRTAVAQYRRDNWRDQDVRVEVWAEKGTVRGTLGPVLDEYGVTFRVMHGYGSATTIHDIAEDTVYNETPLIALYIGDWDPSGMHMSEVDLPERLERYDGEAEIVRIALTEEDVSDPSIDALGFDAAEKIKDGRYRWFVERYGHRCWELDAMRPDLLRGRVAQAIESMLDMDAWNHAKAIEAAEVASMRMGIGSFMAVIRGPANK